MKPEPGLHKQVSSIFDGVKVPGGDSKQNESVEPGSETGNNPVPVQNPGGGIDKPVNAPLETNVNAPGPGSSAVNSNPAGMELSGTNKKPQPDTGFKVQKVTPPSAGSKFAGKIRDYMNDEDPEKARQKKMSLLVGILFIVFISILAFVFQSPDSANANNTQEDVEINIKKEIAWVKPEPIPENMRDPMSDSPEEQPADNSEQPEQDYSKFVVTGIVQGLKGNSAIVSSKVLFEGEEIYGATVVKINDDSVEFEMNGQKWTQPLKND